ncbi:MAG: hypothetical protein KIT31_21220 [Deltaproteobacteria bacterium]|nr:hypothetical protein [Deltaproteobacteria bacterium]
MGLYEHTAGVAATLDLSTVGTSTIGAVVRARMPGVKGNSVTVSVIGTSPTDAGLIVEAGDNIVQLRIKPGVTTIAQLELLIASGSIVEVASPGSPTQVINTGDLFGPTNLEHGEGVHIGWLIGTSATIPAYS